MGCLLGREALIGAPYSRFWSVANITFADTPFLDGFHLLRPLAIFAQMPAQRFGTKGHVGLHSRRIRAILIPLGTGGLHHIQMASRPRGRRAGRKIMWPIGARAPLSWAELCAMRFLL